MRELALLLNCIIVGLGHVLMDRHLAGLLHFFAFAICVNGILVGEYMWIGDEAFWMIVCMSAAAAMVWLYSMSTLVYYEYVTLKEHRQKEMERHYVAGLQSMVRGEGHEARKELRSVLDLDAVNLPARLAIVMSYRDDRQHAQARKLLKECSRLDREGLWSFEIQELLRTVQKSTATSK